MFIDIHTHNINTKKDIIAIYNMQLNNSQTELYEKNKLSVGIHPWDIENIDIENELSKVEYYSLKKNIIAIGEIGIDRHKKISIETQKRIFIKQLEIAEKQNKPVIIHAVKSYSDIIEIKKKRKSNTTWIIHDYKGNQNISENLLAKNCIMSFGKSLIKSPKIQNIFKELPINSLFLETDNSGLSIYEIYKQAAYIKNISVELLKKRIFQTYLLTFA